GGRWNLPGTPVVYAAQSRALAALEALVHFGDAERHIEFVLFEIDIPDDTILRLDASSLAHDWRSPVPRLSTQSLGSEWQSSARSAALLVPSVLIPQESCVLLNPEHVDSRRILVKYPEPFAFDARLTS
ncbi:MAG TPA: RES family NAD+ phosphorylase, partial [Usitatibacter sp.]|nr:RES family NAD+ phosphorylase [Usitatibacter sp.]